MKQWILAAVISAALTGCSTHSNHSHLPAGVTLVERISTAKNEVGIPYSKYQLANGLTVILHQDNRNPLVHVDVTYHVGSAREQPGRSGYAHLFEHMMFEGSAHVASQQHFQIVTDAGGRLNGTTNKDRTNYFETVPSNQLEKMLWLESDRMGFLLPALTQDKFDTQLDVVKNERAQNVDNQPYGQMYERLAQALYPAGHPYSWPTIGWPDDLNRANLADMQAFFQRWYGPNNATLTIGGDFDEAQALTWIAQYFADIPTGPTVSPIPKTLVTLDSTRYISMEDNVHSPLINIDIPTVYAGHPDEAPLDILAMILGQGKTSLIYKNITKPGYAVSARAGHFCQELACQFNLYATANPASATPLADLENKIMQSIAEFEQRGVTDDDLEKVKASLKSSTIFGWQKVSDRVSTLALYQTFEGNPNLLVDDLARYQNVTKEDINRVFKQYLQGKPQVVMSIVPKGMTHLIAHSDNFTPSSLPVAAVKESFPPQTTTIAESSFNRSIIPTTQATPVAKAPTLWTKTLANGIEVMGTVNEDTPTVDLSIYLKGGFRLEQYDKEGVASLTAQMLNQSSSKRSAESLSQALQMLGSSVYFGAGSTSSHISISALTENIDATLAIVEEMLFEPGFLPEDFERLKVQQLQGLQNRQFDADYLADLALDKVLYDDDTPSQGPISATLEAIAGITLNDIKAFYQQQYRGGAAQIIAISNLNDAQLLPKLNTFSQWAGEAMPLAPYLPLAKLTAGTVYLVDKPDAVQSVIKIAKHALPYSVMGDFYKADLMNFPLGGSFNSRININLRQDKGYTYGAYSGFSGNEDNGTFVAAANVRTDATALAIKEFMNELGRYQQQGMTDNELEFMRNSVLQSEALSYESPSQKMGLMRFIQRYQLPHNVTAQQADIVRTITKEELNQLAASLLNPKEMVIIVVGNKAQIEADITALGYPVKELDL